MQLNTKASQPLSQQLQVEQVVIITEETDRQIVAALNDMGRYTKEGTSEVWSQPDCYIPLALLLLKITNNLRFFTPSTNG